MTIKLIVAIAFSIIMALLIRRYFLYVTVVSSYSMYPLLKPGDRVFTLRIYRFNRIYRGNILIFYSNEMQEMMIKRIIGLPGDHVNICRNGDVYINREKLEEPYVQYRGGSVGIFEIPERKYFLLGDNRVKSRDCRHFREAYISQNEIRGKAILCLYPMRRV